MAITTAICDTFRQELLGAEHDLSTAGHTVKISLYTSAATLGASTTAYTATNEISGTGYVATGQALSTSASMPAIGSSEAWTDFADEVWTTATFTARGCLIYNDTHASDASIQVHDFGADKTATAADFTIQFPVAAAGTAIIRLA